MPGSTSGIVTFGVALEEEAFPFPRPPQEAEAVDVDDDDRDPHDLGAYLAKREGAVSPFDDPGPGYDPFMGWPDGQEPADWRERVSCWRSLTRRAEEQAAIELCSDVA